MKTLISERPNFFNRAELAFYIQCLFDRRRLWEDRSKHGVPPYRNGNWFTLGASVYMDLTKKEDLGPFVQKTTYFNVVLQQAFPEFFIEFLERINQTVDSTDHSYKYLNQVYRYAPYPGFHIFPPEETLQAPFGKVHTDLQWEALFQMPDFPFDVKDVQHFTFTLPLVMPYQGGGMFLPDEPDDKDKLYNYKEGSLYVHSGQFPHQVRCLVPPVTPLDWRITFQGHGFTIGNVSYLYW